MDDLRLRYLKELKLSEEIQFDKIPITVMVKSKLSKARRQYFSFICEEGATYMSEYLEERRKHGKELTYDSPLLQFNDRGMKKNALIGITLVTRDRGRRSVPSARLHAEHRTPPRMSVAKEGLFRRKSASRKSKEGWIA